MVFLKTDDTLIGVISTALLVLVIYIWYRALMWLCDFFNPQHFIAFFTIFIGYFLATMWFLKFIHSLL
jgi:hypothetical protein